MAYLALLFSALAAAVQVQTQAPETPRMQFFKAIRTGDAAKLKELLTTDPKLVEERTKRGSTTLQFSKYAGHLELVPMLRQYHAPVDFGTAIALGMTKDAEAFLKKDRSLAKTLTADGYSPLCLAAGCASPSTVKLLLKYKADPLQECRDFDHVRPIHSAAFGRNLECVKLIVRAGADVNQPQDGNFTAIDEAAGNGDLEIVKFLVAHGAKVDIPTKNGKTAIQLAEKHPEVVAFLKSLR